MTATKCFAYQFLSLYVTTKKIFLYIAIYTQLNKYKQIDIDIGDDIKKGIKI